MNPNLYEVSQVIAHTQLDTSNERVQGITKIQDLCNGLVYNYLDVGVENGKEFC